jgi:arylsulfatase A-like enzyme
MCFYRSSVATLCAVLMCCFAVSGRAAARKPNQILILVDDMGRDWVGAYGAANLTPNFDRLAAEGTRFTTAWFTPLCTPTRVALLTGQYPFHSGWNVHYDVPRWGGVGLDPRRFATTMGTVLHEAGYATAIAGKWQINDLRLDPAIMRRHGFDEHCLWTGVESGNPASEKRYWGAFLEQNGERRAHDGEFGPDVVQRFALDFIRRHRDQPFFLYYPMINVHAPNESTPLNRDHPPSDEAGLYAGMVSYTDRQVGELLRTLDELGIAEETIIYFAGDNGSSTGGTLNGRSMPGAKSRVSDLGVHVPLIVRAPGRVRAGAVSEVLTDATDLLPTLSEFGGATLPATGTLDGHSLVAELTGKKEAVPPRKWIFTQYGEHRAVRDARYFADNRGAFFDLVADPLQEHDLASDTSPAVETARRRLQRVLSDLPRDGDVPFPEFSHAAELLRETQRLNQERRKAAAHR